MPAPFSARSFSFPGLMMGLCGVAGVTALFSLLIPANPSTAGFFYIIVVLATAARGGFREPAIVSLTATVCFNLYFLPPFGVLDIADPENWVALGTFLVTALVASHLSDRAQQQAAEARLRQAETEQLYALSRSILLKEASHPVGTQAALTIARIFDCPGVALLDAETGATFHGGTSDIHGVDELLRAAVLTGNHERDASRDLDVWPIALGGRPIGGLAMVGLHASDGAVHSMLNLVAIALERVRAEEAANRAEAARQSEEFKSTMLDAMAHEFKTPLTSIKAAATGLRMIEGLRPDGQELAAIIDEEADHLSQLVTEAVRMSEIDAGKVTVHRAPVALADLAAQARASFEGRGRERIELCGESAAVALADAGLTVLALRQVLDNALKYADPDSPVRCEYGECDRHVWLRVSNPGKPISERDRERIFDKFYRRREDRERLPGTGLGLHIAREIARIQDGGLGVDDAFTGGVAFLLTLPRHE